MELMRRLTLTLLCLNTYRVISFQTSEAIRVGHTLAEVKGIFSRVQQSMIYCGAAVVCVCVF